ncbi:MAG: TlpA family protein disulfide reductase [Piscinibacter sp.]|nr:TlpA family protein disulfide reductase [Piscinibacter sp.]
MMLTRRHLLLGSAAGTLALGAPASFAAPAAPGEAVQWPAVTLLDGSPWAPEAGRPQVVVFWSLTCPFCQRHNVHVEKLYQAARGGRGPAVLGVVREREPEAVRRHMAARGWHFPVSLDSPALAAALTGRRVVPLTVVVDARGRLKQAIPGEMFEEDVMELLERAA